MELDKAKIDPNIMNEIDNMEGHQFEHFCAELLEYNEFRDVKVTQGSGDYGIDITARYHNQLYGIQCKRYSGKVSVKAVQEVISGSEYYECSASAVITNSTFTPQAIEMAKHTGVRLWDRKYLLKFIDNCENLEFINKFIRTKNPSVPKVTVINNNEKRRHTKKKHKFRWLIIIFIIIYIWILLSMFTKLGAI